MSQFGFFKWGVIHIEAPYNSLFHVLHFYFACHFQKMGSVRFYTKLFYLGLNLFSVVICVNRVASRPEYASGKCLGYVAQDALDMNYWGRHVCRTNNLRIQLGKHMCVTYFVTGKWTNHRLHIIVFPTSFSHNKQLIEQFTSTSAFLNKG